MAGQRKRRPTANARIPSQAEMLETMHEIWLAGLGALADARQRGPKLLEQLLAEGSRIHEETRQVADKALRRALEQVQSSVGERIEGARSQAGDVLDNLEKMFQTRVHQALGQIGVPTADQIATLANRVESLDASVAALTAGRRPRAKGVARGRRGGTRAAPKRKVRRAA